MKHYFKISLSIGVLLYESSSKSEGAIVEIVDLRVESMYSPSDRGMAGWQAEAEKTLL